MCAVAGNPMCALKMPHFSRLTQNKQLLRVLCPWGAVNRSRCGKVENSSITKLLITFIMTELTIVSFANVIRKQNWWIHLIY